MSQEVRMVVDVDRVGRWRPAGWADRWAWIGLVIVLTAGCGGPAATGGQSGRRTRSGGAGGGAGEGAGDAARAMGLGWLTGSWQTGDGRAVERWIPVGQVLVGIGFGSDGSVTRSFEVMVVHADGERLVFTARPNGGAGVAFAEEARGARSITFSNPSHDDPKRVDYREVGGVLIASTEGPGGRQEWRLERTEGAAAPEIDRAAAARGDRAVQVSGASAPGDLGFSIGQDQRGRSRVTVWRRGAGGWAPVFDLLLTG